MTVGTMAPAPDTLTIDGLFFAVRWSHRPAHIGIGIPAQGPPTLAAPAGCRRATIEAAVRGKLPGYDASSPSARAPPAGAPERRYETGESFPYLGRTTSSSWSMTGRRRSRERRPGAGQSSPRTTAPASTRARAPTRRERPPDVQLEFESRVGRAASGPPGRGPACDCATGASSCRVRRRPRGAPCSWPGIGGARPRS